MRDEARKILYGLDFTIPRDEAKHKARKARLFLITLQTTVL